MADAANLATANTETVGAEANQGMPIESRRALTSLGLVVKPGFTPKVEEIMRALHTRTLHRNHHQLFLMLRERNITGVTAQGILSAIENCNFCSVKMRKGTRRIQRFKRRKGIPIEAHQGPVADLSIDTAVFPQYHRLPEDPVVYDEDGAIDERGDTFSLIYDNRTGLIDADRIDSKKASETARHLLDFIQRYGRPGSILTDNGGEFDEEFDELCVNRQIAHLRTTPGNPDANAAERAIQIVKLGAVLVCRMTWSHDLRAIHYIKAAAHNRSVSVLRKKSPMNIESCTGVRTQSKVYAAG